MAERFTAAMLVQYGLARRGLCVEDVGVAPTVVVTWQRGIIRCLVETTGAERSVHWLYGEQQPLHMAQVGGAPVSLCILPVGAPATIAMMEEMIACGARTFVGVGTAGSLQAEAPAGTFILPTSCIREEGTSAHYLPARVPLGPSPRLAAALLGACQAAGHKVLSGPLWTTDAPYRETIRKIERYHRRGVLGVDMETSAMYALGQFRGVEVCNLLVVSDVLWPDWRPAFGSPELRAAEEQAARAVLRWLAAQGAESGGQGASAPAHPPHLAGRQPEQGRRSMAGRGLRPGFPCTGGESGLVAGPPAGSE